MEYHTSTPDNLYRQNLCYIYKVHILLSLDVPKHAKLDFIFNCNLIQIMLFVLGRRGKESASVNLFVQINDKKTSLSN